MVRINSNATAVNGGALTTHVSEETEMKIATGGRTVELAYCEWQGSRGLLATVRVCDGATERPVNVRVSGATTEKEAIAGVVAMARVWAGSLVVDGADLRAIADGVQLVRSEMDGDTTTDTYRVRGAA